MPPSGPPRKPLPNIRAVLHWADGQAWEVIIPDGIPYDLRVEGHRHCFNPSGEINPDGLPIWVECPADEQNKP